MFVPPTYGAAETCEPAWCCVVCVDVCTGVQRGWPHDLLAESTPAGVTDGNRIQSQALNMATEAHICGMHITGNCHN